MIQLKHQAINCMGFDLANDRWCYGFTRFSIWVANLFKQNLLSRLTTKAKTLVRAYVSAKLNCQGHKLTWLSRSVPRLNERHACSCVTSISKHSNTSATKLPAILWTRGGALAKLVREYTCRLSLQVEGCSLSLFVRIVVDNSDDIFTYFRGWDESN